MVCILQGKTNHASAHATNISRARSSPSSGVEPCSMLHNMVTNLATVSNILPHLSNYWHNNTHGIHLPGELRILPCGPLTESCNSDSQCRRSMLPNEFVPAYVLSNRRRCVTQQFGFYSPMVHYADTSIRIGTISN